MKSDQAGTDRRQIHMPFGISHPGLKRIIDRAEEELIAHDEMCSRLDGREWMNFYSLRDHHQREAAVMRDMAEYRGVCDSTIALYVSSGLTHDLGKLDPSCLIYRLDRTLTDEERRQMNKHPFFSAERVSEFMKWLRESDWDFLFNMRTVVLNHHSPHKIWKRKLRVAAWDLMLSDAFVAFTENRDRCRLSRTEALARLPGVVRIKIPLWGRIVFFHEIRDTLSVLNTLYG